MLTLWTDDPALAAEADAAGIDRIGPDFERLHKGRRQQGLGYRLSEHRAERLPAIGSVLRSAELFARTNPVNAGSADEVERLLAAGVKVLMLPMFTSAEEVARFAALVAGRARVVALLEQAAAFERLDEILAVEGVDELHVGLNDLALSLGLRNRFALLATPLLEDIAARVHAAGLPLGIGGLGRLGDTSVPVAPDLVYAQHARLGASSALIARTFLGGDDLAAEVRRARARLAHWRALRRRRAATRDRGAAGMYRELTYCSLVNAPPERVAATLAPLRAIDPEVVLAVDDRMDPAWVDGYRQLADRVLLVPYPGSFARTYAWLREHCRGRWILQLDADEMPSAGLAAEVAETIAAADVTHAWIACRWLYPDAGSYLAQWPWRPDYALRLLRNDPAVLRFPSKMHATVQAVGARRFLRAPLYHADLLLNDGSARERKCARYEQGRPGFVIDGMSLNDVYYLPERRDDLRVAPVPAQDAAAIEAFLHPPPLTGEAHGAVARFGLDEVMLRSEDRPLAEGDYRARIVLLDDDLRLVAGEWRTFDVEVCNLGSTRWPGGMDPRPQVRVAYRWIGAGGAGEEGMRTAIGAPLAPGARAIVPLQVRGPAAPGTREIEIDLVDEHVRWFGCGVRTRIEVRTPAGPARGELQAF